MGGINLYRFAGNNPVNLIDPLDWLMVIGMIPEVISKMDCTEYGMSFTLEAQRLMTKSMMSPVDRLGIIFTMISR